jgi:hypothetical protein
MILFEKEFDGDGIRIQAFENGVVTVWWRIDGKERSTIIPADDALAMGRALVRPKLEPPRAIDGGCDGATE